MMINPDCGYFNKKKDDEYAPPYDMCELCYRYDICKKAKIQETLKDEIIDNKVLEAVYILDNTEGNIELRVLADNIEQRNGWVLALWNNQIVGGVKEESLKAFYLTHSISI